MTKMTYKEAVDIIKARIEKAEMSNYKWKRKDGSWWTNHNGQIVPYNPGKHTGKKRSKQLSAIDDAEYEHAYHSHLSEHHARAGNKDQAKYFRGKADESADNADKIRSGLAGSHGVGGHIAHRSHARAAGQKAAQEATKLIR